MEPPGSRAPQPDSRGTRTRTGIVFFLKCCWGLMVRVVKWLWRSLVFVYRWLRRWCLYHLSVDRLLVYPTIIIHWGLAGLTIILAILAFVILRDTACAPPG